MDAGNSLGFQPTHRPPPLAGAGFVVRRVWYSTSYQVCGRVSRSSRMKYDTGCFLCHVRTYKPMNKQFDSLFEDIKKESLSEYERSVSRESLKLFMAEHPARAPIAIRAFSEMRETFSSFQSISFIRFQPAAVALVLALFLGVGTSYAAEGTLPGDALYPVKIHVNEPVQGALAVSTEAKADWNVSLATRRLEEAETLGREGRLTPEVQAGLVAQFESSADNFDANVRTLASATGSPAVVAAAASNLEVSLQAHEVILTKVADSAATTTAKNTLALVRERVHQRIQRAQRVRVVANSFAVNRAAPPSPGNPKGASEDARSGKSAGLMKAANIQISTMSTISATTSADQGTPPMTPQSTGVQVSVSATQSAEVQPENFEAAIRQAQESDSRDEGGSRDIHL